MEPSLGLEALTRALGHRKIEPAPLLIHTVLERQYRRTAYRQLQEDSLSPPLITI